MKPTKQGKSDKLENSALNHTKEKVQCCNYEDQDQDQDSTSSPISYSGFSSPISSKVNNKIPQNRLHTTTPPITTNSFEQYSKHFKFISNVPYKHSLYRVFHHIFCIRPTIYWHTLRTLELKKQGLTEIHDLDKILPLLETLVLTENSIQKISHLPVTIRTLKINHNRLTDINDLSHLVNLRFLDICDNAISSFQGIELLPQLHTIHAESNKVTSCSSLRSMHQLRKLNLRRNGITRLNFNKFTKLNNLEHLDASYNRIQSLDSINGLVHLKVLNLDHNEIEWINLTTSLEKLRVIRLCFNRLSNFDSIFCPNLHTLYLDNNNISQIMGLHRLVYLKNLSLRDQDKKISGLNSIYIQGIQKLYLSGNVVDQVHKIIDFFSLEYLELCSIQLESLPYNFAQNVPNLRVLYLSDNYLKSLKPLKDLQHLKKLMLINNDLDNIIDITSTIHFMKNLHHLDLRWNPITLKYYSSMPMMMNEKKRICQYTSHEYDKNWLEKDEVFVRQLPKQWLHRRCIFRSVVIKACPTLKILDGLPITKEEFDHANNIIFKYYSDI